MVRYAALGVLMAVGTVYAATFIERPSGTRVPTEKKEIAEVPASRPRSLPAPPPAMALEENTVPPNEAPSVEPAAAEPVPVAAPASGREQPVHGPAPVASAEQWKRAAEGLRDGDYRSANAALEQLTRSGSEAERESALLVQAQVLIAQGRTREAQQLLKVLEGSARAPSVRRKSVELLVRLRDRPAAASEKARGVSRPP